MMQDLTSRPVEILVVDDSPGDVQLIIEALQEAKLTNRLHTAGDGVEALAFLRRQPPYENTPRPDLILLDLNLPKKNGRVVLEEIKADDRLRDIPVVILTTSQADVDVIHVYNLHANRYITKPVDFEQFTAVVQAIDHFWFAIVTLPPQASGR